MLSPVLCGSTRAVIEVPDSSESTPTMKNAASVEVRKTSSHQNTSLQVVLFRNQVSDICSIICFAVHLLCGSMVFTVRISTFSYANWPTASMSLTSRAVIDYHRGRVHVKDFQQPTTVRPLFKEGVGHWSAHHLEKVLFTQHVMSCMLVYS